MIAIIVKNQTEANLLALQLRDKNFETVTKTQPTANIKIITPGQAVCGIRLDFVLIAANVDKQDPKFIDWLNETIAIRCSLDRCPLLDGSPVINGEW